ncbi:hypothetical protein AB205_0167460 [Aquarana catesbeiana]|uniref:Uncharacterized protein n=1 Tax=Aquarana catesbeiana TaxID=8400 RepID=A0A2G9RRN9_AQUCT|nr:hypothetical protein AB205_0167460 [Aquarana catesbeiana]
MSKMACHQAEVPWSPKPVQVQVWFYRVTCPTAREESLSYTDQTATMTFPLRQCPETPPLLATCMEKT